MGPKFNATKAKTQKKTKRPKCIRFQATVAESAADFPLMEGMHTHGYYHHKGVMKHVITTLKWSFLSRVQLGSPFNYNPILPTFLPRDTFSLLLFNNQQNLVFFVH